MWCMMDGEHPKQAGPSEVRMNHVEVHRDECKGCAVCVASCPHGCLELGQQLNAMGYQYVHFSNASRCSACGLCFSVCPEPGALAVFSDKEAR
jgi:NAD-dependent dihydropyrimidine dehydrogenase PreA subunit